MQIGNNFTWACLYVCLCVCVCVCLSVCLSVCSGYNFWTVIAGNVFFGMQIHLDHRSCLSAKVIGSRSISNNNCICLYSTKTYLKVKVTWRSRSYKGQCQFFLCSMCYAECTPSTEKLSCWDKCFVIYLCTIIKPEQKLLIPSQRWELFDVFLGDANIFGRQKKKLTTNAWNLSFSAKQSEIPELLFPHGKLALNSDSDINLLAKYSRVNVHWITYSKQWYEESYK